MKKTKHALIKGNIQLKIKLKLHMFVYTYLYVCVRLHLLAVLVVNNITEYYGKD